MLGTIYNSEIVKVQFLWLSSSSLSNDIGYMPFHLKAFSVGQKYQERTDSLIYNNKQIRNCRTVLKLWLSELIMSKFWDCSGTVL